jgi:DNA-binding LacI/PurR family transcriptional regulator
VRADAGDDGGDLGAPPTARHATGRRSTDRPGGRRGSAGAGHGSSRSTMADIARRLGISKAAVSYALNGQPGVGAATRQKVLEVAAELGWYPSSSARALSGAETGIIGLVLSRPPDLLTIETFFMRFLAGVEQVLAERGSSLLLRVIGEHPDDEAKTYERWWGERRIDGVILVDERHHDLRLPAIEELGIPAVLCGGPVRGSSLPCLWTDHAADAMTVAQHLVALGHTRIVHVSGPTRFVHERARRRGMRRAVAALGGTVETLECEYTGPQASELSRQLLSRAELPTAVVYASDVMALAGMAVASELGVRVPAQLSVVSWDDSHLTTLVHPSVTALWRDTPGYGATAASVLLDLVEGRHRGRTQMPPSTLRVRETTGPAPRS